MAFMFLCTQETESECLERALMGTTQKNALWAMSVKPGDDIFLLNFQSAIIRGPYSAASVADCHDPTAWHGQFPVQIKVVRSDRTKKVSIGVNAPAILRRRSPFSGDLADSTRAVDLWIQENGEST